MYILRTLDAFCPAVGSGRDAEVLWNYCDTVLGIPRSACWMEVVPDMPLVPLDLLDLQADLEDREEELDKQEEELTARKASLDEREEELIEQAETIDSHKAAIRRCMEIINRDI